MHEQIIAFQIRSTSDLWRTWSLINNNCHAFVHSSVLLTISLIILIFSNRCQSSLKRNANDFCSFEPLKYCSFTRLSRRSFRWFWKMCSFKDILVCWPRFYQYVVIFLLQRTNNFLFISKSEKIRFADLMRLCGQPIRHQICLKLWHVVFLAIN